MSTFLKMFFIVFCCVLVWMLSSWPEMIIVTDYHNSFNDSSVITGSATLFIIAAITLLIIVFSILGMALMTVFVILTPLILIGVFFSWPVLFVGVILYWLFKQPSHQKVQD